MFKERGWGHGSVTLNVWSVNRALGTPQPSSRRGFRMTCLEKSGHCGLLVFPSNPTPRQHNWNRVGVTTRPSTLLNRWIQKFVFVISYCSLIEASKIMRNKSKVTLPGFVAVGGNWIILQITPAGTVANFFSVGDNKNNRGKAE